MFILSLVINLWVRYSSHTLRRRDAIDWCPCLVLDGLCHVSMLNNPKVTKWDELNWHGKYAVRTRFA
jgi:hypothetical protein